jgi:hypothetical protein
MSNAISNKVKLNKKVSATDFGAKGDGATNDTVALQTALTYVATNGGTLHIPAGTYNVHDILNLTSASYPFAIVGEGRGVTRIVRSSNYASSVFNIGGFDNWSMSDLTIDGGHALYADGNHGIAFFNCKNVVIQNVEVLNWKNTAILAYASPPSTSDNNNIIRDCYVNGNDVSNNGILIADMWASHIIDCVAVRIGKAAENSPCYALQLKNGVQRCSIVGGYAEGAKVGVAVGTNTVTESNIGNIIRGVHIYDCNTGIAFGAGSTTAGDFINYGHVVSDLNIDMNSSGNNAIDFNRRSNRISISNVNVSNLAAGKFASYFREGDSNNSVEFGTIDNTPDVSIKAAYFGVAASGASAPSGNIVTVDRIYNPVTAYDESSLLYTNDSTNYSNQVFYKSLYLAPFLPIVSGAITIDSGALTHVKPLPEGVSDPTPISDDLTTISGGMKNQIIVLSTRYDTHTVTLKHNVFNLRLAGATDMVLNSVYDTITLRYQYFSASVSPYYYWVEVARATHT